MFVCRLSWRASLWKRVLRSQMAGAPEQWKRVEILIEYRAYIHPVRSSQKDGNTRHPGE